MSEKSELHKEHARLVNKKFFGDGWTPEDQDQLDEIREDLDKMQKEERGTDFDMLRNLTEDCEELSQKAKDLLEMAEKDGV